MSDTVKILIFHRNCLFRDCLAGFLSKEERYDAVGVDHLQSDQAWELVSGEADVLLLDLNLPDNISIQVARAVREGHLDAKVVILVPDEHDRLVECIAAGAHGCVLERSSLANLVVAIDKVVQGETFCSEEIVATMFSELSRIAQMPKAFQRVESPERPLTGREREVLELLEQRKSNKEIASELSVSLFTVKNHVHNILEKLNVENRQEAVHLARQQQMLRGAPMSPPFTSR